MAKRIVSPSFLSPAQYWETDGKSFRKKRCYFGKESEKFFALPIFLPESFPENGYGIVKYPLDIVEITDRTIDGEPLVVFNVNVVY